MVEIDTPELVAAVEVLKAETRERAAAIAAAQSEHKRVQALADKGSVTEKAAQEADLRFEQAKAAKSVTEAKRVEAEQMLAYSTIPAPFDGIVSIRNIDPGDLVSADSSITLIQVSSVSPLRVVTYIPEREAVATALDNSKKTNKQLKLLWIACGKDDFLLERNLECIAELEKSNINHEWHLTEGGHAWPIWRGYLADFAALLFKK